MLAEADAIRAAAAKLDDHLIVAADLILREAAGRVIVTGLGKSGHTDFFRLGGDLEGGFYASAHPNSFDVQGTRNG